MKLAIIGSGNIGKSIGTWAAASGYEVDLITKMGFDGLGHGTMIGFLFLR